MKLVVFGLTITSSWGNGHATLWRGLCRALARRGHDITFYERDVPYYAAHRDLLALDGVDIVLYRDWHDVRHAAARAVADADVAMATSYCPDAIVATELIADHAALSVFYDMDSPTTLDRLQRGEPVAYIGPDRLQHVDLVLSYAGGAALPAIQRTLGARRVAALYGSVDPSLHRPMPPEPQYAATLSYLGTYADDRQPALDRLFIEPARVRPNERFVIGGAQYPDTFPWTPNIFFVRHLPPASHPAFFCSSPLTLNITRRAFAEVGYCPSGRLFEAAACGVAVVSDSWDGLEKFFTPGEEILVVRDTADALAAIDRSRDELARIGRAARERTLAEHTAEHRAVELEGILEDVLQPERVRHSAFVATRGDHQRQLEA